MALSTSRVGDTVTNGLEAYEILEQLHDGEETSLYRVVCKSGRLRNRQLALKKILVPASSSTSAKNRLNTTTSLHQALHHPNIVSLLSAFFTTRETFHVLELCAIGNLSQFLRSRSPQTLAESELRGVTKSLADGLTYLRKELVIHGDINPSNILLTSDYGVKLSNFKHSVRLSNKDATTSSFRGVSSYAAPEMASGGSYGFSVDIWSLGCVMVYCVTGLAPLDANPMHRSNKGPAKPIYDLPQHLSDGVNELISRTLRVIPEERIYLPDIVSHPFLANNMPITSLRPGATSNTSSQKSFENLSRLSRNSNGHHSDKSALFQANKTMRGSSRHASDQSSQTTRNKTRPLLGDIGNLGLRSMLSDEATSCEISLAAGPTKRIVSDPIPSRRLTTPPEAWNVHFETPARPATAQINHTEPPPRIRADLNLTSAIPLGPSLDPEPNSPEPATRIRCEGRIPVDENKLQHEKPDGGQSPASLPMLPVGTARPLPLNATTMSCQTHKTPYGQVTILPSHSLLVDFRESQRRKGLKGDEVFVVEPDGCKISVYSAPHLSSPCCLVEPTQQFSINALPSAYWKQYNDAARLLDQIKQRTPKLVVYSVAAKCTLMANAPQADIELLFSGQAPSPSKDPSASDPSLRIRFSRRNHTLEFARHISNSRGEEWTKKVVATIPGPPYLSTKDWKELKQAEQDAMHHLTRFVRMCDAVESEIDATPSAPDKYTSTADKTKIRIPVASQKPDGLARTHDSVSSASTITSTFSSFNLAPRPPKISAKTACSTPSLAYSDPGTARDFANQEGEINSKDVSPDANSVWRHDLDLTVGGGGMQTRFVPSVGWCIRYASRVSQGGRYRMMFMDGVALDIDVDEEWVEFKDQAGETTVYNIRDCGSKRKIGERMKVFEEFVSLFDDSQAS
ncbi:putative serine threonine-protein kinase PLK4 [Lyophyllum shimeji]|uniref:Serine threonine-protein kinase PLK4 n=1 Tax=Lyophyllum shimeji TaxID=47721 RepID=A0A9P3PM77_LYOSH|nr:putative serine threonine-protein kinase PLK4 [Lyophyllum shimeji]